MNRFSDSHRAYQGHGKRVIGAKCPNIKARNLSPYKSLVKNRIYRAYKVLTNADFLIPDIAALVCSMMEEDPELRSSKSKKEFALSQLGFVRKIVTGTFSRFGEMIQNGKATPYHMEWKKSYYEYSTIFNAGRPDAFEKGFGGVHQITISKHYGVQAKCLCGNELTVDQLVRWFLANMNTSQILSLKNRNGIENTILFHDENSKYYMKLHALQDIFYL